MLRIRKADGSVEEIKDGLFVELTDDQTGNIGAVFFSPQTGKVVAIYPQSADAARYERMFRGAKFADQMKEHSA